MKLWFAFILVSLNHWKQHFKKEKIMKSVVICFHFSIFEPLETASKGGDINHFKLWFAFILVSLNHWKQPWKDGLRIYYVVICFHFSIFEPLETAWYTPGGLVWLLWFAFILVSLNHWKQPLRYGVDFLIRCDLLSF